jgi:hypothetical protein
MTPSVRQRYSKPAANAPSWEAFRIGGIGGGLRAVAVE